MTERPSLYPPPVLLLVRFLFIMLRSRFRSRIGAFDTSVVRFTVMPWDCDLNIHLNAGRFVSFMDISRIEFMGRMRIFRQIIKRGWRPIMGGCVMRYRRSLLPFERFDVKTRVLGWDEKWYYMEHVVERNGALCAVGVMRLLIRGKEGNVHPAEVNALTREGAVPSPALPEFVLRWRELEDAR
jgi:acyl-CoA thioesterase FadM